MNLLTPRLASRALRRVLAAPAAAPRAGGYGRIATAAGGYGRLGGYGQAAGGYGGRAFTQGGFLRREEGKEKENGDKQQPAEGNAGSGESKLYSFEDVQKLTLSPSPSSSPILIDVREAAELRATGKIPGAINIPVTTSPDAFFLSEEEFEDKFGFERPGKEEELVFYCKAGVRSRAAAGLAREAGWRGVGEFRGSWREWVERGGRVERA